jgi:secreted trypsin-like serine protease
MDVFEPDEPVTIILGSHNFYDNGEKGRLRVVSRKYWLHENFTMPSAENDIAVIELPKEIEFTDSIQPIKISTKENIENENDLIVVLSGWGKRQGEYTNSVNLQTAKMKLIPHETCLKFQGFYIEKITKNHICALGYKNQPGKPIMACDGDSGSPLVLASTHELIAVTSFVKDAVNGKPNGNDCKSEIAPAVFVRVFPYLSWISEKTGIKF